MLYLKIRFQQYWTLSHFNHRFKFRWWFFKELWRILNHLIIFILFGFQQNINISYWKVELNFCVDLGLIRSLADLFRKIRDLLLVRGNVLALLLLDLFHFLNIGRNFDYRILNVVLKDLRFLFYLFFHE